MLARLAIWKARAYMKKIIIAVGGTGLLALAWSSAWAQTPANFDVVIKGDVFFTAGVMSQNTDAGARSVEFMNRFRLTVTPTANADNGLTYGARLRLRASLGTGVIDGDQAYVFAKGAFGLVELGTQLNPNMYYHVIAPSNFGTGGIDGDWAIGDAGWIQNQLTFMEPYFGGGYTITTFVKSANRIDYITPRLFSEGDPNQGLLGAVSYAPANRDVFTGVDRTMLNTDSVGNRPYGYGRTRAYSNCLGGGKPLGCDYHDVYELSLRDDETVAGVTVSSGVAYLGGTSGQTNFGTLQSFYDLSAWQAGLQLGYRGVAIGGSFADAGRSAYPRRSAATGPLYLDDQYTWTAGISYETGPLSVGFNYEFGHDAGDLTVPGARTARLYAVGVTYRLAPGLSTALEAVRSATHTEAGFVNDALGFNRKFSGDANLCLWKTQITF